MNWIQIFGYAASICMVLGYLPQAITTIRTRETDGISMMTCSMLGLGSLFFVFNGILMGKKEYVAPLVAACLDFKVSEDKEGYAIYTISNSSDIPFSIDFSIGYHPVVVGPRQSVTLEIGDGEVLTFRNCILAKSVFYSASIDELK